MDNKVQWRHCMLLYVELPSLHSTTHHFYIFTFNCMTILIYPFDGMHFVCYVASQNTIDISHHGNVSVTIATCNKMYNYNTTTKKFISEGGRFNRMDWYNIPLHKHDVYIYRCTMFVYALSHLFRCIYGVQ